MVITGVQVKRSFCSQLAHLWSMYAESLLGQTAPPKAGKRGWGAEQGLHCHVSELSAAGHGRRYRNLLCIQKLTSFLSALLLLYSLFLFGWFGFVVVLLSVFCHPITLAGASRTTVPSNGKSVKLRSHSCY